jgi:hypothetical protein
MLPRKHISPFVIPSVAEGLSELPSNRPFLQQPPFPSATALSFQRSSPFCHPERTRISCFTALTGDHGCGSLQREPHAVDRSCNSLQEIRGRRGICSAPTPQTKALKVSSQMLCRVCHGWAAESFVTAVLLTARDPQPVCVPLSFPDALVAPRTGRPEKAPKQRIKTPPSDAGESRPASPHRLLSTKSDTPQCT